MMLPAIFFGLYKDVRPLCRKAVTALREGAECDRAIGESGFLNTATTPGLMVLHGPSPLLGGIECFHCYLFHSLVRSAFLDQKLTKEIEERVFEESLGSAWGVLGLVSEPSLGFLYSKARHRPLLHAALKVWDEFEAEGERFSDGRDWGIDFWSAQANLQYVLIHSGIPDSVIRSFRPKNGLMQLVAQLPPEKEL